ncbi:MAG TPA: hypothetical protein VFC44_03805 [Candidatus Saccharimonadales bacterium]|nr:hypothetical protein [Candidatus Saccharimonadales bacterium]
MKEYARHLREYFDHWHRCYSRLIPKSDWGNADAAERYLEKYWLPNAEYAIKCRPTQNQIFMVDKWLPDLIFFPEYKILPRRGGCLFLAEDFIKLQKCFLDIGDKFIFVVENTFGGRLEEPPFRMKYPASISWDEITSGNYVSAMILDSSHKEFYVFGETPTWGRYAASDAELPLDLTGFWPERAGVFQQNLGISEKENQEISSWLPSVYQGFRRFAL